MWGVMWGAPTILRVSVCPNSSGPWRDLRERAARKVLGQRCDLSRAPAFILGNHQLVGKLPGSSAGVCLPQIAQVGVTPRLGEWPTGQRYGPLTCVLANNHVLDFGCRGMLVLAASRLAMSVSDDRGARPSRR
jgi:hypothetical protein